MAKQSGNARSAAKPAPKPVATIRAAGIDDTDITNPELLVRLAQEWTYLLRVRSRWAFVTELRKSIAERAVKDLDRIGVSGERLRELATVKSIEIELYDWDRHDDQASAIHEAACEMPWEYLLSTGTRAEGRYQGILISRLFKNGFSKVTPHPPKSILFVESAPGRFKDKYDFVDEEKRIGAAVDAAGKNKKYWTILSTPQQSELRDEVRGANG